MFPILKQLGCHSTFHKALPEHRNITSEGGVLWTNKTSCLGLSLGRGTQVSTTTTTNYQMLVYVSNGKAGPVVKAPRKIHSGTLKRTFVCFKHKKRETYNKNSIYSTS